MKKVCKKRIFIIFSIIMVSFVMLSFFASNVSAELNPDTNDGMAAFADGLQKIVGNLGGFAANSLLAGVATLVGSLAIILYLGCALIFSSATGSIFPTPDNIIFNRIAILDVNFFNPNTASLIGQAGSVIQQLYNSFHTIAVSIFIIAAMIVGIKMALSSVASERAQAKNALVNWLTGIIVLFLMRLIIAAIFEANEFIVWKISSASENVPIDVDVLSMIPVLGKPISDVVNGIASFFTGKTEPVLRVPMYGYSGLLTKFVLSALSGDILSAILLFVLFGQTITLFISYAKRLIYAIILGVCAPLVIAVDTINKSLKGQSTILSNWFKEFVGIVFIQVFHSLLMLVTMQAISGINNASKMNSGFIGVATIVLTSGIVKFEKLYKQIFGISDGMLGGLKGQAGKFLRTMEGARSAARALGDNRKKTKTAFANRDEALKAKENASRELGQAKFNRSVETLRDAATVIKDPEERAKFIGRAERDFNEAVASGWGSREGEREKMEKYKEFIDRAKRGQYIEGNMQQNSNSVLNQGGAAFNQNGNIVDNNSSYQQSNVTNSGNANSGNQQSVSSAMSSYDLRQASKEFAQELSKLVKEINNATRNNNNVEAASKRVEEADKRIRQANKEVASGALATAMGGVNLAAGIGFGLGSGEDLSDTVLRGGKLTELLDAGTEKIGAKIGEKAGDSVYNVVKRFDKHSNVSDI